MSNSFELQPVKIKAGQRIHASQSCLYSNQIEPISAELLGNQRCAFVTAGPNHPGIYSREHLLAVRFLPRSWAKHFSGTQIQESQLNSLLHEELQVLRNRKTALVNRPGDAIRWVHGDADGIPGIVIDDYGEIVVVQSGSQAGDFLLPLIIKTLMNLTEKPLFERSSGQIRALEKLPERTRWIRPPSSTQSVDEVVTSLSGLSMIFRPQRCQKTGLFLDQRENLAMLRNILSVSNARSMLDLCSYAGAWSCAAAQTGILEFTAVDQDKDALELCATNIKRNTASEKSDAKINLLHGDLFEILSKLNREKQTFDVVVADPPAFTKSAKHVPEARRAYQRLSKLASRLVNNEGIYVACSCSRHIDEEDFYEIVSSALDPDDWIYLGRGRQSPDHTVLATDKHSLYLKALYFMRRGSLAQFSSSNISRGENP